MSIRRRKRKAVRLSVRRALVCLCLRLCVSPFVTFYINETDKYINENDEY